MLEARDIVYAYRDSATVDGVTLSLKPGSLLGILGVNGSGKSTLLNCLDDVLTPQSGAVYLDECALSALSPAARAREIAYVTQHSHANRSTVYETLLLGRKPHMKTVPTDADHAAVERVIAEFHLEKLAGRYIDELSGGEYQKMIIARAFVQDTPILLLDEPTNNLDLANQIAILTAVKAACAKRGVAAAAVMHDINLSLWFCDEIAFVQAGKLLAHLPATDVSARLISEVYGVDAEIITHKGRRMAVIGAGDAEGGEAGEAGEAGKAGELAPAVEAPVAAAKLAPAPAAVPAANDFAHIAHYFDDRADTWNETSTLSHATRRRLDQLLPDLDGARVLDVACGTGVLVNYYLRRGAEHVCAIDVSEKMAAHARENFAHDDRVHVLCGDVLTAPLATADVVVIYNAYPHFMRKDALVQRVSELLPPGGICLIAHSMGRAALNSHHGAHAAGVSLPLEAAVAEMRAWEPHFAVTALFDDENFYAIRLQKK